MPARRPTVVLSTWHGRQSLHFLSMAKTLTNQGYFTLMWNFVELICSHNSWNISKKSWLSQPAIFMASLRVPLFFIGSMVEVSVLRPLRQTESEKSEKMFPLKRGLRSGDILVGADQYWNLVTGRLIEGIQGIQAHRPSTPSWVGSSLGQSIIKHL